MQAMTMSLRVGSRGSRLEVGPAGFGGGAGSRGFGVRASVDRRVDPNGSQLPDTAYRASCWYAMDWKDMRCSGDTPSRSIAKRCSGVE